MKSAFLLLPVVLVLGCAKRDEQAASSQPSTPYGPASEVAAYRAQIEPYIQAVTAAQAVVERSIGSRGKVTAANLAAAMQTARPDLESAYAGFQKVTSPPGLASLHDKIRRLMEYRLKAYTIAVEGWRREQTADKPDTSWRAQTQAELAQANALISELNSELQAVDAALRTATKTQVATP